MWGGEQAEGGIHLGWRAKQEKGRVGVKEKSQTVTLILGFEE